MVRKKRSSSTLKEIVDLSRKGSEAIKLFHRKSRLPKIASSEEKHMTREDGVVNELLSDIEKNVQKNVDEDLESAEDSESAESDENEPIPDGSKLIHNKKNARKNSHAALREIRKYQKSTDLLIPKGPFARVCKQIFQQYIDTDLRVAKAALECLQESAEIFLVSLFQDSYLCTLHAQRKTLMNKDIRLARRISKTYYS